MNTNNHVWTENRIQFPRLLSEIGAVADLSTEQMEAIAISMDLDTAEVHSLFVRAEQEYESLKLDQPNPTNTLESNHRKFEITNSSFFKDYLLKAIDAAEYAATQANVSPVGLKMDESLCDWGEIETRDVVDYIDEAASHFGNCDSENYQFIVDALCEAVTEHFAKEQYKLHLSQETALSPL